MAPGPAPVTVVVVPSITAELAGPVRDLLSRAVPAQQGDDRLDGWPTPVRPRPQHPEGFCAALAATTGGRALGWLGGGVSRNRLQLDGLIDPGLAPGEAAALGDRMLGALAPALTAAPAHRLELWGRPAGPWHEALAARHGLELVRALHQMRGPLPAAVEPAPTRPYTDADLDAVLAVNNQAFAHHPDQGGQTMADLRATMAQPWFRADGLRLHDLDGRVAGFCWTKIHPPAAGVPALGEIYVIGVDPDFHGRGLGAPVTAAGLHWLHQQGISTGMLYVEADNEPAVRTYRRLGFTVVRTDRAWGRTLEPGP